MELKDYLVIIVYIISILTSLWAFWKFLGKKVWKSVLYSFYWYSTGYHVLADIEKSFGREAGMTIRRMVEMLHHKVDMKDIRLDIIENTLSIGIFICDASGKCTYANRTLAEMWGMDKDRLRGNGWLEALNDRERIYKSWIFAVENKIPYSDVYEVEGHTGTVEKFAVEAEPSIKEDVILGYVGVVRKLPN